MVSVGAGAVDGDAVDDSPCLPASHDAISELGFNHDAGQGMLAVVVDCVLLRL